MRPSADPAIMRELDVLDSLRLPSGLTFAAPGAAYDRIWIRDNCYVGLAYWHAGLTDRCIKLFQGLLKIMDRYAWKIDWILWEGKPSQSYKRVHPRYDANGFEIPEPWGFIQNDAIGLLLWCIGWLEERGAGVLTDRYIHLIQKIVWYLSAVRYWDDPDNGVWEEINELHASSISCCLAGLQMHRWRVMVPEEALAEGTRALEELGCCESPTRKTDMAQLTMIWPLGYARREIVEQVEGELLRKMGVIRYLDDLYHLGSAEAEWTMGLPWLGLSWLALGDPRRARHYLDRTERVRHGFLLPEAYIPHRKSGEEVAYEICDHTPLGWSHALALILRRQLEEVEEGALPIAARPESRVDHQTNARTAS